MWCTKFLSPPVQTVCYLYGGFIGITFCLSVCPPAYDQTRTTGQYFIFVPGGGRLREKVAQPARPAKLERTLIEPTCAICTLGSYASLSVCMSVCLAPGLYQKSLENNSYFEKSGNHHQPATYGDLCLKRTIQAHIIVKLTDKWAHNNVKLHFLLRSQYNAKKHHVPIYHWARAETAANHEINTCFWNRLVMGLADYLI